jgi:hypothetical protein
LLFVKRCRPVCAALGDTLCLLARPQPTM